MDEKNPLQIYTLPTPINKNKVLNKRGRPTIEQIKQFGPEPKSIIAKMLSEMKARDNTVEEVEPINENDQTQLSESDKTENNEPLKIHVGQTCCYRSVSVKEHKRHLTTHQRFLCDYPNCDYSCKLSSNLIKHNRVHTNEKPYLCDRCSFRSNFVNSLKAHKRTHTAEKPYHCKHCSYKCNSSSNLKKHCHLRHRTVSTASKDL